MNLNWNWIIYTNKKQTNKQLTILKQVEKQTNTMQFYKQTKKLNNKS